VVVLFLRLSLSSALGRCGSLSLKTLRDSLLVKVLQWRWDLAQRDDAPNEQQHECLHTGQHQKLDMIFPSD
jgi:hypothetical protein